MVTLTRLQVTTATIKDCVQKKAVLTGVKGGLQGLNVSGDP